MKDIEWQTSSELIEYPDAVSAMEKRIEAIQAKQASEQIWFLEHPPIYTAGTSTNKEDLIEARFPVYETGRGGEFTYHGPGQRVVYVMLDLAGREQKDIRKFVWVLEQWVINALARFGIHCERRDGRVGLWVVMADGHEKKIAAIGVRVRKWITYHGIAINLSPDLSHFNGIVPCGIKEHGVTSFYDLGQKTSMTELDHVLKEEGEKLFHAF